MGDILDLAQAYSEAGADELVFRNPASVEKRLLDVSWVEQIARYINIPSGGGLNL